jgi:hypothetical protein
MFLGGADEGGRGSSARGGRGTDGGRGSRSATASQSGPSARGVKRAREELPADYDASDGVRAPIEARTERLVDIPGGGLGRVRAPVLHSALRNAEVGGSRGGGAGAGGARKPRDLSQLLAPPADLLYIGTFDEARVEARTNRRWLLVNIQAHDEFACLTLNRDVWRDESVAALLRSRYVLWQQERDFEAARDVRTPNAHALSFLRRYKLEGGDFPRIALIDGRSGELLWDHSGAIEPRAARDYLRNWVVDHGDWNDARPLPLTRTRDPGLSRPFLVQPPSALFNNKNHRMQDAENADMTVLTSGDSMQGDSGARGADRSASAGVHQTDRSASEKQQPRVSRSNNNDDDVICIDEDSDDDNYDFVYDSDGVGVFGGKAPTPPRIEPAKHAPPLQRASAASDAMSSVPVRSVRVDDGDADDFGSMLPADSAPRISAAPAMPAAKPSAIDGSSAQSTRSLTLFPVLGEPPADAAGVVRIQLRFPGGARSIRRFFGSSSLSDVAKYAAATLSGDDVSQITLKRGTPPFHIFSPADLASRLSDSGVANSIIIVERASDL